MDQSMKLLNFPLLSSHKNSPSSTMGSETKPSDRKHTYPSEFTLSFRSKKIAKLLPPRKRYSSSVTTTTRNLLGGSCSYSEIKKETIEEGEMSNGVSTELTLFSSSFQLISTSNNNLSLSFSEIKKETHVEEDDEERVRVSTTELSLFPVQRKDNYTPQKMLISTDDGEKARVRVSTQLSLFYEESSSNLGISKLGDDQGQEENLNLWKIKKGLTESDLGHLSRLLVQSGSVNKHVLPLLGEEQVKKVLDPKEGFQVRVWDCDTQTKHNLVFKRWGSSKGYVFVNGWIPEFVKRRNLKKGDTVGLYWDVSNSRFNFSLLQKAA